MSTKSFAASQLEQFKSICHTDHALNNGAKSALEKAGYSVTHRGAFTTAAKGHTELIYRGNPDNAEVRILKRFRHA